MYLKRNKIFFSIMLLVVFWLQAFGDLEKQSWEVVRGLSGMIFIGDLRDFSEKAAIHGRTNQGRAYVPDLILLGARNEVTNGTL